jgi:hypothetical protein
MSLPQDLNPVDLFTSSGDSAAAPNEQGHTDSCWQLLDKQNQCLSRLDNRQRTKSRDPGMLFLITAFLLRILKWMWHSRYSDWLRAGWSGARIPVGARFFAHVKTSPGAHPASCTMGTGLLLKILSPPEINPWTFQPIVSHLQQSKQSAFISNATRIFNSTVIYLLINS